MDFDCWTSLKIGGISYIIAEKIRYKEKTSDDVWTEYGLITTEGNARTWLSISDGGLSCSLSTAAVGSKPPRGYRLHDSGTQVVTGVWGDTDASVGDEAKYEQYESANGTETFFVENWCGTRSSSAGRKIAAADIAADETSTVARLRNLTFSMKQVLSKAAGYVAIVFGVFCVLSLFDGVTDLDTRDWHDFRSFVGVPYALHERLSDAPYYTEEQGESGARIYTAQTDAATAALDLIEGVDGNVQDAYEDGSVSERALVIRTQTEVARITSAPEGTARITVTERTTDLAPAAEKLERGYVLMRYATLVRTGDQRGRAGVVLQESPRTLPPPAASTNTASTVTEAASPTAAPAPTTPTGEETPRQMRHLAH